MSSPSLFHWYANFKKRQALGGAPERAGGQGGMLDDVELDELKEKFMLLQKHYVVL